MEKVTQYKTLCFKASAMLKMHLTKIKTQLCQQM